MASSIVGRTVVQRLRHAHLQHRPSHAAPQGPYQVCRVPVPYLTAERIYYYLLLGNNIEIYVHNIIVIMIKQLYTYISGQG